MATASITSNEGFLDSAPTVPEVLHIKQASKLVGAASIRNEPNPDIKFVETDQDQKYPAAGNYVKVWSPSGFFPNTIYGSPNRL